MKVDQNLLFIALELGDMDEEEFLMFYDINGTQFRSNLLEIRKV